MKVLFSNPPWWVKTEKTGLFKRRWIAGVRAGSRWPFTRKVRSKPGQSVFGDYLPYPFFMGYAATYAAKHTDAEVSMRDSLAMRESYKNYYQHISNIKPDYLFIEIATPSWEHDSQVIRRIQEISPQTRIVVTGPITMTKSQHLLDEFGVHACIKGEYEKNSVKVIEGAQGVLEHDLLTVQEMNDSPFPYYDQQISHQYCDANPIGQKFPHAHVWSSRGCPFKCIFCVWPAAMTGNDPDGSNKRRVRYYSPEYMHAFLSELIERYQYKSIYFDDDTFNLGNSHVVRMCEVMRKLDIPWSAMCRADTVKRDTWQMMKDSGCFGVKLGFESGSQYVVDQIVNKHLDLTEAADVVRHLKQIGMTVHGTFTYGLPGESREQMLATRQYIESLPFDSYQESGTAEIEGTPLHTLREKGALENYQGAKIDGGYNRQTDGHVKYQQLVSELKNT